MTPDPTPEESRRYTIHEIASLAGLSTRTVRYYIAEALVDRPLGTKRGAWYVQRHLEQLLLIRRWTDAGLSLDRVRELQAGAPEDAPPRPARPGPGEVWSRITRADGLELQVEPGRAGLSPEQLRELLREVTAAYHRARDPGR